MEIKYLTKEEKEFIKKNCETKTITEISIILKMSWNTVNKFIIKENLKSCSKRKQNIKINGVEFTPREFEILKLIAKGFSDYEIINKLFISLSTLKTHYLHILDKLYIKKEYFNNEQSIIRVRVLLWYYKNVKNIDLESEE